MVIATISSISVNQDGVLSRWGCDGNVFFIGKWQLFLPIGDKGKNNCHFPMKNTFPSHPQRQLFLPIGDKGAWRNDKIFMVATIEIGAQNEGFFYGDIDIGIIFGGSGGDFKKGGVGGWGISRTLVSVSSPRVQTKTNLRGCCFKIGFYAGGIGRC